MKQARDYFALDWIKGELDRTLSLAREALEAYAQSGRSGLESRGSQGRGDSRRSDDAQMRACLSHLHQVHGTLVMLELTGIALLADELERLAQALLEKSTPDPEAAEHVLMRGILQVSAVLEEIQKGVPDSRRAVLPLANEVRLARGEEPFDDASAPGALDLHAPASEHTLLRFREIDGTEKARKIRAAYQQVLLAILRGDYGPQVVGTLGKVAVGLERICEGTALSALWRAFGVFVKSLHGEARLSSDVVKLLRRVDAEIKVLAHDGRKALARPLSTELVRTLVEAARARGFASSELDALAAALSDPDEAGSEPSAVGGNQALRTAAAALRDELATVKDELDLLVRSDDHTVEQLKLLSAPLKRIGSTLSVLGFESSRAIIAEQVEVLNRLAEGQRIEEPVLLSVASALLQVDENLSAVAQQGRRAGALLEASAIIDHAQLAVLAEARNGLDQVKHAVVDYVSSHWDKRKLEDVPPVLGAVKGALGMLGLTRPADLLGRCATFVARDLLGGRIPDWPTLDTLADAVSGIDYYLERLCDRTNPGDDILSRAERSVSTLETVGPTLSKDKAPPVPARAAPKGPLISDDLPYVEAGTAGAAAAEALAEAATEDAASKDGAGAEPAVRDAAIVETGVDAATAADARADPEEAARESMTAASLATREFSRGDEPEIEIVLEEPDSSEPERARSDASPAPEFDLTDEFFDDLAEDRARTAPADAEAATPVDAALGQEESIDEADPGAMHGIEPEAAAREPLPPERAAPPHADPDIVAIFVEEVSQVLGRLEEALPALVRAPTDLDALREVRRAFHTLKGSGRVVGAHLLGELAWSIENLLNRVLDHTLALTDEVLAAARDACALMPALRDAFESRRAPDQPGVRRLIERAERLASGAQRVATEDAEPSRRQAMERAPTARPAPPAPPAPPADLAPLRPGVEVLPEVPPAASQVARQGKDASGPEDEGKALFRKEAAQLLDVLEAHLEPVVLDSALLRALHTLRGSASLANVAAIERIATPLYRAASSLREAGLEPDADLQTLLRLGSSAMRDALERGGAARALDLSALEKLAERIVRRSSSKAATPLVALEGVGVLVNARDFLKSWHEGAIDLGALAEVMAALREIRSQAESQRQRGVVELCDALIGAHERLEDQPLDRTAFAALDGAHELLLAMFDRMAAHQDPPEHRATIALLAELQARDEPDDEIDEDEWSSTRPEEGRSATLIAFPARTEQAEGTAARGRAPAEVPAIGRPASSETAQASSSRSAERESRAADRTSVQAPHAEIAGDEADMAMPSAPTAALPRDVDPEILEIFFDESDELLETIDHSIHDWLGERDNRVYLENVLRALHTLKGGARLAGLAALGDETHAFESFLIQAQQNEPRGDDFFREVQDRHDELTGHIAELKVAAGREPAVPSEALPPRAAAPTRATPSANEVPVKPVAPVAEPRLPAAPAVAPAPGPSKAPARAAETQLRPDAASRPARASRPAERDSEPEDVARTGRAAPGDGREHVRVSAPLLEQLVNLAGESSIIRSRIEQGINDFGVALEEMETTIERVREQLRRLEIETEAQVLFRHERTEGPQYEEFDPLEMDRYSHLQQLARSLTESASDMLELKETLSFKSREAETLLIQQARINTELQEGLMRTRMVPFSRLLPRLRRIVRQVSSDLGKDVDLHVYNAEGELDRNVLERMVPPLEHMLRNAIDHGIELPEVRRQYGKPPKGRIDLRLSREAGDVVIEIADDGAGIDIESVRRKAIERRLMSHDADLSDEEVLQFVLAAGFSTAKTVTQISGRGVGMDVVQATVKQLGGNISIASTVGKGTRFVVRLPFTVSVNRALMVSVNDDLYAVPLNTIEGIVRITSDALEKMYAPNGTGFEYAGVPYRVRYLGSYLGREYKARPEQASVPVVLLRSGDIAMAIHVDGVQGSREIVVKSLGPQFAGVAGISGATILGDGSVVVILDLLSLIRSQMPSHQFVAPPLAEKRDRPRCVMVVDDSVTVRKVTSRLLERQGMDVMVAKDGVEAIAMLRERRPDIVLLDIEMPRMDGFEVARQIRHDELLANLPIVMISSRTGAKHQEHAMELGVNRFLGKPFQESELLATIDELAI